MKHLIIGDVHGRADLLINLLGKAGIVETNQQWRSEQGHQVVFVGDLVDRGSQSAEVVRIARTLTEQGVAHTILGNHEYNLVQFHTPDPEQPGEFLRPHTHSKLKENAETLVSYDQERYDLDSDLEWFKTLPVAKGFSNFQVVHACWHQSSLAHMDAIGGEYFIPSERWVESAQKGSAMYGAVESLCKGIEKRLPNEITFFDKGQVSRNQGRVAWWESAATDWRTHLRIPDDNWPSALDQVPFDASNVEEFAAIDKPTLFGHYWFQGTPTVCNPQFACLDYSAVHSNVLVGYLIDEADTTLVDTQFVVSDCLLDPCKGLVKTAAELRVLERLGLSDSDEYERLSDNYQSMAMDMLPFWDELDADAR